MDSLEIQDIITRVEASDRNEFLIHIEDTGHIELNKKQVLTILKNEFSMQSLNEFREWIESQDVKYNQLAKLINLHPVKFTQMITGHIKSTKQIGSTLEFIEAVKKTL